MTAHSQLNSRVGRELRQVPGLAGQRAVNDISFAGILDEGVITTSNHGHWATGSLSVQVHMRVHVQAWVLVPVEAAQVHVCRLLPWHDGRWWM